MGSLHLFTSLPPPNGTDPARSYTARHENIKLVKGIELKICLLSFLLLNWPRGAGVDHLRKVPCILGLFIKCFNTVQSQSLHNPTFSAET